MQLYAGSDGTVYTEKDLGYRFETGTWRPCMWDPDEGWDVVETADGELLWLVPVDESALPDDVDVPEPDTRPTAGDASDHERADR